MDMAEDALKILDHFNIDKAYILGTSMGGKIAQLLAIYFPNRIRALFITSSSTDLMSLIDAIEGKTSDTLLPGPSDIYLSWIRSIIQNPASTQEERNNQLLDGWRFLNGNVFPFEEQLYRTILVEHGKRQGANQQGVGNHIAAIKAWKKKERAPARIDAPTYIFWGTQDPIFFREHAESILRLTSNGDLTIVEGMGHNLNKQVYEILVSKIIESATH